MLNSNAGITAVLLASISMAGCTSTFLGSILPASSNTSPAPTPTATATASASVKVPVKISVNPSSLVILQQTEQQLTGTVQYADGTFDGNVSWASSDNTIVSVNSTTGLVTGVKPGVASITATSPLDSTKTAIITVTVEAAPVSDAFISVSPGTASIPVHSTIQLAGYLQTSAGQTDSNYTWSSSNQAIAVVTNGLVTGIAPGTVSISATSIQDPTKSGSATIVVMAQ